LELFDRGIAELDFHVVGVGLARTAVIFPPLSAFVILCVVVVVPTDFDNTWFCGTPYDVGYTDLDTFILLYKDLLYITSKK